jgi:hypothetical protein
MPQDRWMSGWEMVKTSDEVEELVWEFVCIRHHRPLERSGLQDQPSTSALSFRSLGPAG